MLTILNAVYTRVISVTLKDYIDHFKLAKVFLFVAHLLLLCLMFMVSRITYILEINIFKQKIKILCVFCRPKLNTEERKHSRSMTKGPGPGGLPSSYGTPTTPLCSSRHLNQILKSPIFALINPLVHKVVNSRGINCVKSTIK